MKISCPTCAAKYSVADEKIQSRLAKIRCRKCSSTIVIDGTATPASVYIGEGSAPSSTSAPPQDVGAGEASPISARTSGGALIGGGFGDRPSEPVGPAADEYAVDIADNDQRNMTIHQIVGAYNEGLITADTYIWKEGMADWQTLSEVRDVAEALHAAARPMGAPAAVRRPGPSTDLFGSIDTAGGENDITTSAPQPMATAGTGARNESSVLFSLSALTATPEPAAVTSAKRGRASADDSGLIDLQALTSAEATAGAGAFAAPVGAFGASPLISAPLGGVSGPAMGASLVSGYGRRSSRMSLVIAASVLAVGIIGAAAVVVKRGGTEEGEPTSSLDKEAAAAPSQLNADPMKPVDEEPIAAADDGKEPAGKEKEPAEKDSVAADDLPTAAEPAPVAKASAPSRPVSRPSRAPARAKPQPAPAPAPEPVAVSTPKPSASASSSDSEEKKEKKKAPSRCECKPSDLMCAMKCSAKR